MRRRGKFRFTPEIIALYETVLALWSDPEADIDGDEDKWRQYLAACRDLNALLGRKIWEVPIADTIGEDEPPERMKPHRVADWQTAHRIRVELDGAVG